MGGEDMEGTMEGDVFVDSDIFTRFLSGRRYHGESIKVHGYKSPYPLL
jgi:hypothetical protein